MAGSEILIHYLRDYAIAKGEHTATGEIDNLARATYAVYNGGPGHLRRYRKDKVHAQPAQDRRVVLGQVPQGQEGTGAGGGGVLRPVKRET